MKQYQPVVGLEIHVELKTVSKMFCRCSANHFGEKPNTHCCPVCLGLPGALPVANEKAIQWTVLAGMALGCQIQTFSKFDRKNYFYPDLPKGYQISQYDLPLCRNGLFNGVKIRRVHLEEDTAKLIHTKTPSGPATLIDFNRCGVPLMEIVTEPDIKDSQQALDFLKKLQQIIRYLGISDCDMEKGSMRLEVNVSLREINEKKLPDYKVEIKNLNSFRFVGKALKYEVTRQEEILQSGRFPIQETRGWDESKQYTYSQRVKEEAQDYRYFPEPDIPPIRWSDSDLENLHKLLPELPDQKVNRFLTTYGISNYYGGILTETPQIADYFEEAVRSSQGEKLTAKDLANAIVNQKADIKKTPPSKLIKNLLEKRHKPKIEEKRLEEIVEKVISNNQKAIQDYKKGKKTAIEYLIGQVFRETRGGGDSNIIRKLIKKLI